MEFTCKGLSKYVVGFKFIILLAVITIKSISSGLRHQLRNVNNMNIVGLLYLSVFIVFMVVVLVVVVIFVVVVVLVVVVVGYCWWRSVGGRVLMVA